MSENSSRLVVDDFAPIEHLYAPWQLSLAAGAVERDEIERTEGVRLDSDIVESWLYADQDTSKARVDFDTRRDALIGLLQRMTTNAPSWDGEPACVSRKAATTAAAILAALPNNRRLPQAAPDGEGGVMLVWARTPARAECILGVEEDTLHLVVHPGTPSCEHIDDVPFTGGRIPIGVLHHIPMK